jgi:hypothetical protein
MKWTRALEYLSSIGWNSVTDERGIAHVVTHDFEGNRTQILSNANQLIRYPDKIFIRLRKTSKEVPDSF